MAVGYLFISGFSAVAEELGKLEKVRVLVGRTDRATLDEVAAGCSRRTRCRQRLRAMKLVRRSDRAVLGAQAVQQIARGRGPPAAEAEESEQGVRRLRDLIASGRMRSRPTPRACCTPRRTSAGTRTMRSPAPPSSAPPTSRWPASPAIRN